VDHMHPVTKSYRDFPAAHRQPQHAGHCRLIHGHNWGFDLTFQCGVLDSNGFVVDVGELKAVKMFLTECFDHTLLLNEGDPLAPVLRYQSVTNKDDVWAKVVLVKNCGMEGLAQFVLEEVNVFISNGAIPGTGQRGLRCVEVVCLEDSKNSATYKETL